MAKQKTIYICQNCGAESPKWTGQCFSCNQWNTFVEEISEISVKKNSQTYSPRGNAPTLIQKINPLEQSRVSTQSTEFDRVLGGGIVPGSLILLGGEPGIGKSTLSLQTALQLKGKKVLYISGEESLPQIKLRSERIAEPLSNCFILSETKLEEIMHQAKADKPDLLIIDSVQTLQSLNIESAPGSVSQIRECTNTILQFAKESNVPVILIGHINKDGAIAGPKVLEHIVDVVLQFEGDNQYMYRILRSIKNRFGSTAEIGIFEMNNKGLREVSNPSEMLLSGNDEEFSGVAIAATMEGARPFLIEVQALASTAAYGTPQRSSNGLDLRRLNMLLAVLEKRAGFKLQAKDVFLNIAGGLKVNDPAIDLAVLIAILSSNFNISVSKKVCFAAEVGLTGEIRTVNRIEQRISEAEKLGFSEIYISQFAIKALNQNRFNIKIRTATKVEDVFKQVFG